MEIVKNLLRVLWRVWFYIVAGSIIIILLPVLIVLTSSDRFYPTFFKLARAWAKVVLFLMGFKLEVTGYEKIKEGVSYAFSANHTSMIDIFVMLSIIKNPFVFVGKQELAKLPIFGFFYKRTCILVDRANPSSRKEVYQSAQQKLDKGFGVCIFPEGLVPEDESVVLSEFKNGVFSIAIDHQIPIVPIILYDCKEKFSYTTTSGSPGILRVKILDIIETNNLTRNDRNTIRKQAYDMMYQELINDIKNRK